MTKKWNYSSCHLGIDAAVILQMEVCGKILGVEWWLPLTCEHATYVSMNNCTYFILYYFAQCVN